MSLPVPLRGFGGVSYVEIIRKRLTQVAEEPESFSYVVSMNIHIRIWESCKTKLSLNIGLHQQPLIDTAPTMILAKGTTGIKV